MESRFWNKVNKKSDDECWEWISAIGTTGYGHFNMKDENGKHKNCKAHRLAFELHHKRPIQEGMYILHSCDNRKCCNPNHLSEGTAKDNTHDMIRKNRHYVLITKTKITEAQKVEIIEKYKTSSYTYSSLAREYNVTPPTIVRVIKKS